MNKKEIAQRFTRQMLGQEPSNDQQEQVNPPQEEQQPELTQIQKLLPEIERLHSKALKNYRIRAKDSRYQQAAGADGQYGKQPRLSDTKDCIQRGADIQSQQQDRQQVGHQALPGSDLIGSLLGTGHPAGDMDQNALNEFKRKRKKRKGQKLC
ncbi:hypothetical protein FPZ42_07315 [Mucilaginibacter achroorhodeus]|uniref:Uncharacterized protein n=1 Tax=Mucilaginibacter achroorhodeus TaxID=2599294 RepID=A0A563U6A2_9SPHI|nr:hypothetical protein [Mucilaginibacter achroorhodeus]TWR26839.1 hypothetical protein FPZ42_07315 [Mucilaginibacter achroorhodeus]